MSDPETIAKFSIPEDRKSGKKSKPTLKTSASKASFLSEYYEEEHKPDFSDPGNRSRFTAIVFSIITFQLMFTVGCALPFVVLDEAKQLVLDNSWVIFVFLVVLIVPYFMLVCCETTRKEFPTNIVLLLFLTIGMAGTCACCTVWFETVVVLYTFVLTVVVTFLIAILACGCRFEITSWKWILVIMGIFLFIFVLMAIVIAVVANYPFATFLYPGILVAIFSAFLLHDIKSVMGGHRVSHITPSDYIVGAAQVYVDVVGLFLTFLEIVGTITEND